MRWALIVPWAASLVITARLFTLLYDYYFGILNRACSRLGIRGTPIDFLGDDRWTMASMIAVGVFVSLPFTTYVLLAGLKTIPHDVYEAARVDGASPWQTYSRITLPLLRPALLVASVLNIIYVFNSFPIVYTLNDRNPGFAHDTTITFMYKLAFKSAEHDVGMAAAAGVANVLLILVVVLSTCASSRWKETSDEPSSPSHRVDRSRSHAPRAAPRDGGTAPSALCAGAGGVRRGRVARAPYARDAARRVAARAATCWSTPPTLPAREWQWYTFGTVLSDERFLNWLKPP